MTYGIHVPKVPGPNPTDWFTYTGLSYLPWFAIEIRRPVAGTRTTNIPAAPAGYSYTVAPMPFGMTGLYDPEYDPPPVPTDLMGYYAFPEASSIGQFVKSITVTNAGLVTYVGASSFESADASYYGNTQFMIYLRKNP